MWGTRTTSPMLDFPQHLRKFLQDMRNDVLSHDVVFLVENKRYPAHRALVSAVSPVLCKMLTNGMKETNRREISLKEVCADTWKNILDYMYTAQMDLVNPETALHYLECANRFQIEELEQVISDYIEERTGATNCFQVLDTADRINSMALRKKAMMTIFDNFHSVWRCDWFLVLEIEIVREILTSTKLMVKSEHTVFVAAVRYIACLESSLESTETIAKQTAELLAQHRLIGSSSVESFYDCGTYLTKNAYELFDCVNLDNLSSNDLRRINRFCREWFRNIDTSNFVKLAQHIRQFYQKVTDKSDEPYNSIPNLPVEPLARAHRGRNDFFFTVSNRFFNVSADSQWRGSPYVLEKHNNFKWRIFLSLSPCALFENFLSCDIYGISADIDSLEAVENSRSRTTLEKIASLDEKQDEGLSCQLFVRIIGKDDKPESIVFFRSNARDLSQNNANGTVAKTFKKIRMPKAEPHESLLVQVAIFMKPDTLVAPVDRVKSWVGGNFPRVSD